MTNSTTTAEKATASSDDKAIPLVPWQEIVDKWAQEEKMVLQFSSPVRFGAKKALGYSTDERPRIEGCEAFDHEATRPFRTLFVTIEDQHALDQLRDRLTEVANEYTQAFCIDQANRLRTRRQRIPASFEPGRH